MGEIVCSAGAATCTIVANRPKWSDVYRGYPKSGNDDLPAPDVFASVLTERDYDPAIFSNACATRVSLGLLEGGMTVKRSFNITNRAHRFAGRGFVSSAKDLDAWLFRPSVFGNPDISIVGPTTLKDLQSQIGSKNEIYIMLGGFGDGVTGHATLWVGAQKDVIGGHNYADYPGTVHFWELID